MTGRRLLSGLAALSLLTGAVGAASADPQHSGTEAEQDACTSDVFRLCQDYIPNEAPIVACLKVNRAQLSPACYRVFYSDVSASRPPRHKRRHHRATQ